MVMELGGLVLGSVFMGLIFAAVSIIAFVFWIMMLVDVIKRNFKKSDEKVIWVLVVIFAGIIGALIYYFVVKRYSKK
jgi:beta-lactamase regulating signal transducer with metallopeptidase domain